MHSEPRRILVLDDSRLVLDVLRAAFEAKGVVVDTAQTLDELEAKRESTTPDVILLDIQMPEAWGDDVAATLRGVYEVKVPIVLMSTLPVDELRTRAASASADGFVSKRDGLDKVVARITELLDTGALPASGRTRSGRTS